MSGEQRPHLPETEVIEPIVQCGVLYLGTGVPSPGLRGLDSIQEPLSHRYPIDGTNAVRGIDAILSIYDNGLQLTFARQPHTVIFYPITSLIYCASLRYSVIEDEQAATIGWRFTTLDSTSENSSKHPPLFCAVLQRTNMLAGDECHCFITKNDDAALTLVRTISEVYANLQSSSRPNRSPLFYQLDRYGRKISETNGTVYLSPAIEDESNSSSAVDRDYLLDPTLNGFFYRTDAIVIEQWHLWDDEDRTGSRPRPPPSPFGQNEALYHDDVTRDIHRYLRQRDDEDTSSTSSSSSDGCSRSCRHRSRHRDEAIRLHWSSFDPTTLAEPSPHANAPQGTPPIIIEKILPNPLVIERTQLLREQSPPTMEETVSNPPSDAVPSPHHSAPRPRSRKHRSTRVPVINLESIESLFDDHPAKLPIADKRRSDAHLLDILEGYFEHADGREIQLHGEDAHAVLEYLKSSTRPKKSRRRVLSSTNGSIHHRQVESSINSAPLPVYGERSSQPASKLPSIESKRSASHNDMLVQPLVPSPDFASPLRYMQSSLNPLLLLEYQRAFTGV